MTVTIGSARIDENGHASGGAAGDQTGKEVSTQNWYKHSKGWRVLRCKVRAKALMIAEAMKAACANNNIGYDQGQRLTLYNEAKLVNFDPAKVKKKVETDCSALVRVCMAYAGITCGNFTTDAEARMILDTGMFTEMTGSQYTDSSSRLQAGDILVTKTRGHTVVVLNDGPSAGGTATAPVYKLGDRVLKNGSMGDDVKELQNALILLGFSCGSYGPDGDFGDCTEMAVRKFQREHNCAVDGEVGPETFAALKKALVSAPEAVRSVKIVGGDCYVRDAPNKETGKIWGIAYEGGVFTYLGKTSEDGWFMIEFNGGKCWVSGKYGRLI